MSMAIVGITAPLIVMDTDIFSRGMPMKRVFMSSTESMAIPAIPMHSRVVRIVPAGFTVRVSNVGKLWQSVLNLKCRLMIASTS